MLKIEHLTKTYGDKKAVDDLSLHILPGEIYGFIGHNGAGKTTTLKSVAGILQFDAGEITIDGNSVRNQPLACKKEIAYIPDNPDLYDYMTGIKFLNFIADIFGISAADRQARIHDYAERFELTADLAQPIASYSHGMKQKLAIIAAWIHQPKLIIMDEPFVGLDPKAAHLLKGMMREVCDEGGDTVETMDVAQGNLCMGFTTPITNRDPQFPAMQLLNTLYGGGMTSKLFQNVREKQSLCYSVSSQYYGAKGVMAVYAGIDPETEKAAREEILRQLDACRAGDITEEELTAAREAVISSLRSVHDSPGAIEGYYAPNALGRMKRSPQEHMDDLNRVTVADVTAAANTLTLHTTYFLRGECQ